jgi:hypothetical protein
MTVRKVYELSHEVGKFADVDDDIANDGYLEEFEGWDDLNFAFWNALPITIIGETGESIRNDRENIAAAEMPGNVSFIGLKSWLPPTDFPYIDQVRTSWPIMSRKMIEVLISVGDFPHQVIPVIFKAEDEDFAARFCDGPSPVLNHDYAILQLLKISNFLDLEKSEYENVAYIDGLGTFIHASGKIVLKEPKEGFPPIFRVEGCETYLYISGAAKEALERAGIQGVDFDRVEYS